MGEIAEMMLDGTLCQHCGSALPGNGDGYPRDCGCQDEREDVYSAIKEEKKDRHARWKKINMKAIIASGIPFREAGNETLLFREPGKPKVDYYPSTGRYRISGKGSREGGSAKSGGARAERFLAWYRKQ